MDMENNAELRAAYIELVENQIRENEPPETRQTYDRLCTEGFTESNAKILIASVIAYETYLSMKSDTQFNHDRFVRHLNKLPEQPFEDD